FFFSSGRRHTRCYRDWSSDVCSSDLVARNLLDFVEAWQVAPALGAAAIACSGGVAAFVGTDSPLTTVKGAGPELGAGDVNAAERSEERRGGKDGASRGARCQSRARAG